MKKIIFLITALLVCVSCSKEDEEDFNISVSQNELEFSPEGGELVVGITSDFKWISDYTAEWLLVRQQSDKIRVIADSNPLSESRSDVIKLAIEGNVISEIIVTQLGVDLNIDDNLYSMESRGGSLSIPVNSNTQWTFESQIDWCEVNKDENNLLIIVKRNYDMDERNGIVTVKAGNISYDITISQFGCQWFESFEMIEVEGGTFYMGAQKENSTGTNYDASAYQIESPVHQVSLSSYSIGKFEVTQTQWIAAMGNNPSNIQGKNLPVENVSWEDVQVFISILNEKSGFNYRLPTEAEWEFAAKGGNNSVKFNYSGNSVLGACGWYYSNSEATPHEVGSKVPNELGIYDMSGNVREWCNDWFGYYSSSMEDNPQGAYYGSMKVNRGGSWTTPAVNCRNSYRHSDSPSDLAIDLGFRLVLSE